MHNWNDLQYFLAIARHKTIRRAARHLGVTHATASRRLLKMEEDAGTPLFERVREGHRLTTEGYSVLQVAERVEEEMASLSRELSSKDKSLRGSVTLSMLEPVASILVMPVLTSFHQQYPNIMLDFKLTGKLTNLAQRETDIALRLTGNPPENAIGRKIAGSPLCIYGSDVYLQNRRSPDNWLVMDYEPAKVLIPGENKVISCIDGLHSLAEAIRSGAGLGVLPCFVGDNTPGIRRAPGVTPKQDIDLWLLMHPDSRRIHRVQVVFDFLRNHLLAQSSRIEGLTT